MIPRVPPCSQLPALMKETTRSGSGEVSGGNQAYAGRGIGLVTNGRYARPGIPSGREEAPRYEVRPMTS